MRDPTTNEILGYEATYVGASEYTVQGETRTDAEGKAEIIPATFTVTSIRQEAGVGDRLAPVPAREYTNYAPHPPAGANRRPDRLDLRRRADRRPEPDRRAQQGRGRRHRARPRAGALSRRQGGGRHRPRRAAQDQAARRAPRRAVRVPRLRPHVVRADPVGEGAGLRRATASRSRRLAGGATGLGRASPTVPRSSRRHRRRLPSA